jgi:hypothetical protein
LDENNSLLMNYASIPPLAQIYPTHISSTFIFL